MEFISTQFRTAELSPGLSLHFEESFPTERAFRLACPGWASVFDGWNLDGACTKRQGVSPQALVPIEMLPSEDFFCGMNKMLKSPGWSKCSFWGHSVKMTLHS